MEKTNPLGHVILPNLQAGAVTEQVDAVGLILGMGVEQRFQLVVMLVLEGKSGQLLEGLLLRPDLTVGVQGMAGVVASQDAARAEQLEGLVVRRLGQCSGKGLVRAGVPPLAGIHLGLIPPQQRVVGVLLAVDDQQAFQPVGLIGLHGLCRQQAKRRARVGCSGVGFFELAGRRHCDHEPLDVVLASARVPWVGQGRSEQHYRLVRLIRPRLAQGQVIVQRRVSGIDSPHGLDELLQ
jgi:hypothetical protein